jgi:hypothetical protein
MQPKTTLYNKRKINEKDLKDKEVKRNVFFSVNCFANIDSELMIAVS